MGGGRVRALCVLSIFSEVLATEHKSLKKEEARNEQTSRPAEQGAVTPTCKFKNK